VRGIKEGEGTGGRLCKMMTTHGNVSFNAHARTPSTMCRNGGIKEVEVGDWTKNLVSAGLRDRRATRLTRRTVRTCGWLDVTCGENVRLGRRDVRWDQGGHGKS
jgi:hypothetical protein